MKTPEIGMIKIKDIFEGTKEQFEECFFTFSTNDFTKEIIDFCEINGFGLPIIEE